MSFDTRRKAQAFGKKIQARLRGDNWTIRVWENLGWHVCWRLGRVSLYYASYDHNFSCLIADDDTAPGSGSPVWTTNFSSSDPNAAVKHDLDYAVNVAKDMLRGLDEAVKLFEGYNESTPIKCGSCGWLGDLLEKDVKPIEKAKDFFQRVIPGEPMPAGECPVCESFVYLVKEE